MQDLSGKSAFVTGAASGIGLAIAKSLAREGVAVAIADIDHDAAKQAAAAIEAEGGRSVPIQCDVTDEASLASAADAATDAIGVVHILVNNAGAFTAQLFEETSRRDWQWLLNINVLGVVAGLHTFLPRMRAHGEAAHILNTASVSGHIAVPSLSIYTASKFAVVGLSECLRVELAGSNIAISVLCPGIVKTGLLESSARHRKDGGSIGDAFAGTHMTELLESGSDPAEVGDQVVEGIVRGDFYIFTHPNVRPSFEARFSDILDAYRS